MKKIFILLALLLLVGCYADKGNYDYRLINEITVKLDKEYGAKMEDVTITIKPEVMQSLNTHTDNLVYTWLHSTVNSNFYGLGNVDTISHDDHIDFHIDPNDKNLAFKHYFRFNVLDKETGIEYPYNTKLTIVKPYHGSWLVLHRQDATTQLGAIEYVGNKIQVSNDAYYNETSKHLLGNPVGLFLNYNILLSYWERGNYDILFLATDNKDESGVYCQWQKFAKMDNLSRMVAPSYREQIDYAGIHSYDATPGGYGATCLSDGVLYQSPAGMKLYKAHVKSHLGNTYLTHASKVGFVSVCYDKIGKRFLYYYANNRSPQSNYAIFDENKDNPTSYALDSIPKRDTNVQTTNPNKLSDDKEVLYVGSGYEYNPNLNNQIMCYGLARSLQENKCYVYEFRSYGLIYSSQPSFSGFYEFPIPEGLTTESCFASSLAYNGIIFYTSGNKVYRLDFMQGKATLVYTHTGGEAKVMKFASKGRQNPELDFKIYEHNLNRSLAVAFEKPDGTSDVVVLNLDGIGKVDTAEETWPSTQVHTGFGKVKDILFL